MKGVVIALALLLCYSASAEDIVSAAAANFERCISIQAQLDSSTDEALAACNPELSAFSQLFPPERREEVVRNLTDRARDFLKKDS